MQHSVNTVTLITGGSRSGKSSHALTLAETFQRKLFIATAQALDAEMTTRIAKHKKERGMSFRTVEEPLDIAKTIRSAGNEYDIIVLDCLTVWLGNLQFHLQTIEDRTVHVAQLLDVLDSPPCSIILVTNEVGMGIVPENDLARRFRDEAGYLNQQVARLADRVILMISGIPLVIKG
jgi:adenosylcobinamide kinase/adenosylcobinamide-phosphate guanylyltransferase